MRSMVLKPVLFQGSIAVTSPQPLLSSGMLLRGADAIGRPVKVKGSEIWTCYSRYACRHGRRGAREIINYMSVIAAALPPW